jgi:hypothetical protein
MRITFPRRRGRMLLAAAAIVASAGFAMAHSSPTYASWCFDDPVVQVGNNFVQTTIGIDADPAYIRAHVRSATLTYHLPSNVPAAVVLSTSTPYFPESVKFVSTGIPVAPGQPIPVSVTVSFQTDLLGQLLLTRVDNTTQPDSQGAQTGPSQGQSFTTTTPGLTLLNLTRGGFTWQGSLPPSTH